MEVMCFEAFATVQEREVVGNDDITLLPLMGVEVVGRIEHLPQAAEELVLAA